MVSGPTQTAQEPRVQAMRPARTIGLPAYSIPVAWLPVRVGPWPAVFEDEDGDLTNVVCGWWLCENEHAGGGPGTALHVLYCSLPYGHGGECVWQNPTPKPMRGEANADGQAA